MAVTVGTDGREEDQVLLTPLEAIYRRHLHLTTRRTPTATATAQQRAQHPHLPWVGGMPLHSPATQQPVEQPYRPCMEQPRLWSAAHAVGMP